MSRWVVAVAFLALAACDDRAPRPLSVETETTPSDPSAEPPQARRYPWPAGDLRVDPVHIQFAVYGSEPQRLRDVASRVLAQHQAVADTDTARVQLLPVRHRPPPSSEQLGEGGLGVGLDADEAAQLRDATHLLALKFEAQAGSLAQLYAEAQRIVGEIARQSGGVPFDVATGEAFGSAAWTARTSLDPSKGLAGHYRIDVVPSGGLMRLSTAGLVKFGLPEIFVEEVPGSVLDRMKTYIGAVAVAMHRETALSEPGVVPLGGGRVATLMQPTARSGDGAEGRLVELFFPGSGGSFARQHRVLDDVLGRANDDTTYLHSLTDPELLRSAARARKEVVEILPEFAAGSTVPGDLLLVKVEFPSPQGVESMWVDVTGWDGQSVVGILQNQPRDILELSLGQRVRAPIESVCDYLLQRSDGSRVGDYEAAIFERRGSVAHLSEPATRIVSSR
ncbi:MAG: DUF2314 domain-containing protein [Nannocystaceae bacterium]|nr:DUF2314 domain-containing protein [bacterium]